MGLNVVGVFDLITLTRRGGGGTGVFGFEHCLRYSSTSFAASACFASSQFRHFKSKALSGSCFAAV